MTAANKKIAEILASTPKVDIHEHLRHPQSINEVGAGIKTLAPMSYIGPFNFYPGLKNPNYINNAAPIPEDPEEIIEYIRNFPEKSAVGCFLKPFASMYRENLLNLDCACLSTLEQEIWKNYQSPGYYSKVMKKYHITDVIYDIYEADLASRVSEIFGTEVDPEISHHGLLRINSLLYGFDPECWDPRTNLMPIFCKKVRSIPYPTDFGGYLQIIDQLLEWAPLHYVGIKCASAYERTLDFGPVSILRDPTAEFEEIFGTPIQDLGEKQILRFGNYIMHYIITKLPKSGLPLQIHTGTALTPGSRAKNLSNLIAHNPEVTFDLLHFGYPWTGDVIELINKDENVYTDFVWLPQLDMDQIPGLLTQIANDNLWEKILGFGGDCACIEGSIGALEVLLEKSTQSFTQLVEMGKMDLIDVEQTVKAVFYENPKQVFSI